MLKKRKVDVVCIQETKWKGGSTKEVNGFKLWYSGVGNTRNDVGIMISSLMKENIVEVNRVSDRIMKIKFVVNEEVVNIVSVYAPHVGLSELARKNFWDCLDEIVRLIPGDQILYIEGDGFYDEDVNRMWNRWACTITNVATDMLGVTSRKVQVQKEAWWWDQEVQERVKIKHNYFRELLCCQDDEQVDMRRILYKEAKRTAKKTVAEAKSKAYEAMYNHLGTKEGQNGIYRLAKVRERRRRDLGFVKCIKDVNGHVLLKDKDIRNRWHNYFRELFNEERIGVREI
ncbi:hypothetical protein AgCh_036377 [Apium graveolens]